MRFPGTQTTCAALAVLAVLVAAGPSWSQTDDWDDWEEDAPAPVAVHGFVEASGASRVVDDPTADDDYVLGEARFRLDLSHYGTRSEMSLKGDFVADALTGESTLDIRQAWLKLRSGDAVDWRLGRQILTWGTGDLLFLNDLFPKDFVSFFVGRDDEFLKAPSNTLKGSLYTSVLNVDVAWTPVFTPDRGITGEVLSFTNPADGQPLGPASPGTPVSVVEPARTFAKGEWAARLHRRLGGLETALYGYLGHFKQPTAYDAQLMQPTYAPMAAGGASVRGNLLGGLYNLEGSWYDSLDDRDGTDPFLPNSQGRGLVGYERELRAQTTLGLQAYVEWTAAHDELLAHSPDPAREPAETRTLGTMRLTWRLLQQTLTLSLFGFVGLEDGDTHWRPVIQRQWTDQVQMAAGANIMTGDRDTFFGQLQDNTNVYLRFRYSL